MNKTMITLALALVSTVAFSQVGIGTTNPDPSAILDVQSTDKGFLPPRINTAERDAISSPAEGLVIYNTDNTCLEFWNSSDWISACDGSVVTTPTGDATFSLPQVQFFTSANDGATPTYHIMAQGVINDGDQFTVPYTSGTGNFASYTVTVQDVAQESTVGGTRDLTISYDAGTFSATGDITVTIGVSDGGTSFSVPTLTTDTLDFATFDFQVNGNSKGNIVFRAAACIAKINATDYASFLCHNLGADESLDPHEPDVGLQGAYIQWGKRGPNTTGDSRVDWFSAPNDGPNGFAQAPTASDDNDVASISGWSGTEAPNGSWNSGTEAAPIKTANDPCPNGFRVPTRNEWEAVVNNNTASRTGTFVASSTNYGAALHFGPDMSTKLLTLPATGYHGYDVGELFERGNFGRYWSSTESSSTFSYRLVFNGTSIGPHAGISRKNGYSVRCIKE